jgi:cytochrome P450
MIHSEGRDRRDFAWRIQGRYHSVMSDAAIIPLEDPDFWQDPYPLLSRLREQHRTAVTDAGLKAILRWDDCEALLKSGDFINQGLEYLEERGFKAGGALYEWRRHSIGALNGPDHSRIRSLVSRAMTHRSVDALRPRIRAHAKSLLEATSAEERIEARSGFATRLPFLVITDFLGIRMEEALEVAQQLGKGSADAFGPRVTQEIRDRANSTFEVLMAFVAKLYEDRRRQPRDDMLTALTREEEDGDRLSQDELIVLFTNIFGGAIETTASLIASGVYEIARHPEQADLLRADPARWKKGFAEETLRMRPGFYAVGKKARRRIEAFGLVFEEEEPITIPIGAPNRDPRRWQDPERFDARRDPKNWSMTFSMGAHFCLGQALARCEIQEALAAFVEHCDEIELEDQPRWLPHVMVNRLENLPIRYCARHN